MSNPTQRLIEELKKTGKNQPELADLLPVSVSTISRWFSGDTSHVSRNKRELIANIMGFDIEFIETGERHYSQNEPVSNAEELLIQILRGETSVEIPLDLVPEVVRLRNKLDDKIQESVQKK